MNSTDNSFDNLWLVGCTMEINFLSKVYPKSLLKRPPLSCTSLEEIISSPHNGTDILVKGRKAYLLHRMDTDILGKYVTYGTLVTIN